MSCVVEMDEEASRKIFKVTHEVTVRYYLSPHLLGAIQDVVNSAIPTITSAVVSALGPVLTIVPATTNSGEAVPTTALSTFTCAGIEFAWWRCPTSNYRTLISPDN